ncbi:hypothetical protein MFU01_46280 [Myxococcus fulvus]|uniref:Uncharacterized protein n=1 Tax=Myxococcus fulvus TaxID=33 RepID=A0A511T600_MYXFU|nr:hypothetical protein MFU01_46280 [Myxococcus fulvus]
MGNHEVTPTPYHPASRGGARGVFGADGTLRALTGRGSLVAGRRSTRGGHLPTGHASAPSAPPLSARCGRGVA